MEQNIIPVFRPSIDNDEIEAVTKVLKSGWLGMGKITEEFEKQFAKYIGVKHAIALNSCTEALRLSLVGLEPGDEVITTPLTFVSTIHAILYNGGKPVFADVLKDDLTIDPADIEKKITLKTKTIIPVHLYGNPCRIKEIMAIAENNDLKVIEDCAHACGSNYSFTSDKVGSWNTSCWSFHAVKNLACGDGGMITTNDDHDAERFKKLRWLGISKSTFQRSNNLGHNYGWEYDVEDLGYKCHMNDISASIGLCQLKKLDENNHKRKEIALRYEKALSSLVETIPFNGDSACHIYAIRTPYRDKLNLWLRENGISSGVHYKPIYSHSYFAKMLGESYYLPTVEKEWQKLLSLPIYPDLSRKDQEWIILKIKEFFNEKRN